MTRPVVIGRDTRGRHVITEKDLVSLVLAKGSEAARCFFYNEAVNAWGTGIFQGLERESGCGTSFNIRLLGTSGAVLTLCVVIFVP